MVWAVQDCIAQFAQGVQGVLPWLCQAAAIAHVLDSPRKRPHPGAVRQFLEDLVTSLPGGRLEPRSVGMTAVPWP